MQAAQEAVHCASHDDQDGVLRAIHGASGVELGYAVAYLASALVELGDVALTGSKAQKRRRIREAIRNDEDVVMAAVNAILHEAREQ